MHNILKIQMYNILSEYIFPNNKYIYKILIFKKNIISLKISKFIDLDRILFLIYLIPKKYL